MEFICTGSSYAQWSGKATSSISMLVLVGSAMVLGLAAMMFITSVGLQWGQLLRRSQQRVMIPASTISHDNRASEDRLDAWGWDRAHKIISSSPSTLLDLQMLIVIQIMMVLVKVDKFIFQLKQNNSLNGSKRKVTTASSSKLIFYICWDWQHEFCLLK